MQIRCDAAPRGSHTLDGHAVFGTQSPQSAWKRLGEEHKGGAGDSQHDTSSMVEELSEFSHPLTMGGIT